MNELSTQIQNPRPVICLLSLPYLATLKYVLSGAAGMRRLHRPRPRPAAAVGREAPLLESRTDLLLCCSGGEGPTSGVDSKTTGLNRRTQFDTETQNPSRETQNLFRLGPVGQNKQTEMKCFLFGKCGNGKDIYTHTQTHIHTCTHSCELQTHCCWIMREDRAELSLHITIILSFPDPAASAVTV